MLAGTYQTVQAVQVVQGTAACWQSLTKLDTDAALIVTLHVGAAIAPAEKMVPQP